MNAVMVFVMAIVFYCRVVMSIAVSVTVFIAVLVVAFSVVIGTMMIFLVMPVIFIRLFMISVVFFKMVAMAECLLSVAVRIRLPRHCYYQGN